MDDKEYCWVLSREMPSSSIQFQTYSVGCVEDGLEGTKARERKTNSDMTTLVGRAMMSPNYVDGCSYGEKQMDWNLIKRQNWLRNVDAQMCYIEDQGRGES